MKKVFSLNPCCSGRYSMSLKGADDGILYYSLNPCCSGRYSMRTKT